MIAAASRLAAEPDDARNAMLDLVESNIDLALGLGLEAPLRARLARMLPGATPSEPDKQPDSAKAQPVVATAEQPAKQPDTGAGVGHPTPAPVALPDPLDLAAILTACRDVEAQRLRAGQHAAIARLKTWLVAEIGRAMRQPATAGKVTTP